MSAASPTRRALMGGVMGIAAFLAAPTSAGPTTDLTPGMVDLLAKLDTRRRAQELWEVYRETEFYPMEELLFAARRAIPHETTNATYDAEGGSDMRLSTEGWHVGMARRVVDSPAGWPADYLAASYEVIALADARDARLAEIDVRFNVAAIKKRESDLMNADIAAARAILAHPCTTTDELLAKLRFIATDDAWDMTEAGEGIAADLERINAGGQA